MSEPKKRTYKSNTDTIISDLMDVQLEKLKYNFYVVDDNDNIKDVESPVNGFTYSEFISIVYYLYNVINPIIYDPKKEGAINRLYDTLNNFIFDLFKYLKEESFKGTSLYNSDAVLKQKRAMNTFFENYVQTNKYILGIETGSIKYATYTTGKNYTNARNSISKLIDEVNKDIAKRIKKEIIPYMKVEKVKPVEIKVKDKDDLEEILVKEYNMYLLYKEDTAPIIFAFLSKINVEDFIRYSEYVDKNLDSTIERAKNENYIEYKNYMSISLKNLKQNNISKFLVSINEAINSYIQLTTGYTADNEVVVPGIIESGWVTIIKSKDERTRLTNELYAIFDKFDEESRTDAETGAVYNIVEELTEGHTKPEKKTKKDRRDMDDDTKKELVLLINDNFNESVTREDLAERVKKIGSIYDDKGFRPNELTTFINSTIKVLKNKKKEEYEIKIKKEKLDIEEEKNKVKQAEATNQETLAKLQGEAKEIEKKRAELIAKEKQINEQNIKDKAAIEDLHRKELSEIKKREEELEMAIQTNNTILDSIKTQRNEYNSDIINLNKYKADLEKEKADIEKQKQLNEADLTQTKQQLEAKEKELNAKEKAIQLKIDGVDSELKSTKELLDEKNKEYDTILESLNKAKKTLDENSVTIAKLEASFKESQTKTKETQTQLDATMNELNELKASKDQLNEQLNKELSDQKILNEQLKEASKKDKEEINKELGASKERVKVLENDVKENNLKIANLEASLGESQSKTKETQSRLNATITELNELKASKEQLNGDLDSALSEQKSLNEQLKEASKKEKEEISKELNDNKELVKSLRDKLDENNLKIANLESSLQKSTSDISVLQTTEIQSRSEILKLQNEIKDLKSTNLQLNADKNIALNKLEAEKRIVSGYQEEAATAPKFKKEIATRNETIQNLENNIKELNSVIETNKANISDLEALYKDLQIASKDALDKTVSNYTREIQDRENLLRTKNIAISEKDKTIEDLKGENKKLSETSTQLDNEHKKLKEEKNELDNLYNELGKSSESNRNKLLKDIDAQNNVISEHVQNINVLNDKILQLESQITIKGEGIQSNEIIQEQIAEKRKELDNINTNLLKARSEFDALQLKLKDPGEQLLRFTKAAANMKEKLDNMEEEKRKIVDEITSGAKEEAANIINAAKTQNERIIQEQEQEFQNTKLRQQAEIEALQNEITRLTEEKNRQLNEIEAAKQAIEIEENDEEKQKIQEEINTRGDIIKELEEEIATTEQNKEIAENPSILKDDNDVKHVMMMVDDAEPIVIDDSVVNALDVLTKEKDNLQILESNSGIMCLPGKKAAYGTFYSYREFIILCSLYLNKQPFYDLEKIMETDLVKVLSKLIEKLNDQYDPLKRRIDMKNLKDKVFEFVLADFVVQYMSINLVEFLNIRDYDEYKNQIEKNNNYFNGLINESLINSIIPIV